MSVKTTDQLIADNRLMRKAISLIAQGETDDPAAVCRFVLDFLDDPYDALEDLEGADLETRDG